MKTKFYFIIGCLFPMVISTHLFAQTDGLTIPSTHPQLWWNASRLQQAKAWWTTHQFTPDYIKLLDTVNKIKEQF